ncbi:MAG: hypothetical protein ACLFPY_10050, partial [Desulfonatronovibrio sp.]
ICCRTGSFQRKKSVTVHQFSCPGACPAFLCCKTPCRGSVRQNLNIFGLSSHEMVLSNGTVAGQTLQHCETRTGSSLLILVMAMVNRHRKHFSWFSIFGTGIDIYFSKEYNHAKFAYLTTMFTF